MGMTGECFSTSPTTKEILNTLNTAEKLFWSDLALVARRGNVSHVREAAISLALIRAFQTSLGKAGKDGPTLAARLLGERSLTSHPIRLPMLCNKMPQMRLLYGAK